MSNTNHIIREDLTDGKSLFKIPVFNDIDDDDLDPQFLYVEKNVDDRRTPEKYKAGCKCIDECLPNTCECILSSSIKLYEDGRVKNAAALSGKFYNSILFECDKEICKCGDSCKHRMTPKKLNLKLELFKTTFAGFAVRSTQFIQYGTFITEFVGEVLSYAEAQIRPRPEDYSYLVYNKFIKSGYFVDPTRYGNISRFFNHSCFENLLPLQFLTSHRNKKRVSIGFVACRDIQPGDELTIDYGEDWWLRKIRLNNNLFCQCDAPYCIYPSKEKKQLSLEEAKKEVIKIIREKNKMFLEFKNNQ